MQGKIYKYFVVLRCGGHGCFQSPHVVELFCLFNPSVSMGWTRPREVCLVLMCELFIIMFSAACGYASYV